MRIERKILINQCLIGVLSSGFLILGVWIRHQQDEIDLINRLLGMSLKELQNVNVNDL